jgi:hypothetical protein
MILKFVSDACGWKARESVIIPLPHRVVVDWRLGAAAGIHSGWCRPWGSCSHHPSQANPTTSELACRGRGFHAAMPLRKPHLSVGHLDCLLSPAGPATQSGSTRPVGVRWSEEGASGPHVIGSRAAPDTEAKRRSCPGHLARATCHTGPCSRAPLASRETLSVGSLDHVEVLYLAHLSLSRTGEVRKTKLLAWTWEYLVSVGDRIGRGQFVLLY